MRNIICSAVLSFASVSLFSQFVISEIMFNPPESGTDFLEYIEIQNIGNAPLNARDYSILDAIVFTFPDTMVIPGGFLLVAVDSAKLDSITGARAFKWRSGGLRNTDEVITLLDPGGQFADSVHYFSSWANEASGNGASLALCRPAADNSLSVYWRPSTAELGAVVNGKSLLGTPGAPNRIDCADYTIFAQSSWFDPDDLEIFTGERVEWANVSGTHNVNGGKNVFPSNPVSFYSGAPSSSAWSFIHQFDIPGDYDYQCDVHSGAGMLGKIRVRMRDLNYPLIDIAVLRSTDQNGFPDSLDKRFTIEGVVYGANLRPSGLQFTVMDGQGNGIGIFNSSGNLGYQVQEGDMLRIKGVVNQFNGLTQLLPDSIFRLSTGNALVDPLAVVQLDEFSESRLVKLEAVELVDPQTWTNSPLGFTVKVTNGTQIFDMRIDNDVDIHGTPAPDGKFNVTGIGSQFDVTSPYFEDYQIIPRYLKDIVRISNNQDASYEQVFIYPNPATDQLFIQSERPWDRIEIFDSWGTCIYQSSFVPVLHPELPRGLYLLRLSGGTTQVFKLIIQ
ncbi:MAG: lamin tail domain-containing protein [Saprospiraceae bacterium]|nr:lamin tail domain-containing protein [Saprospiraceae bacterium]